MRIIAVLLSIIFSGTILHSQSSKLTNTLLWRISGNGLTRPSYLYGTMHLTDKRVFQFGDSVYKAIEKVEGFAAELDMNKLGSQMFNTIMADKEAKAATEPIKVKDAVSKQVWDTYKDELAKRLNKPADKITIDDLEAIESLLKSELLKKGDMPTFLDAYLFGLARQQGKWVGGLEELTDQMEHINSTDIEEKIQTALFDNEYYSSGIEYMIKIYSAQQLDSMDVFMYRGEMVRKIIS